MREDVDLLLPTEGGGGVEIGPEGRQDVVGRSLVREHLVDELDILAGSATDDGVAVADDPDGVPGLPGEREGRDAEVIDGLVAGVADDDGAPEV